jgi:hypothetical protein
MYECRCDERLKDKAEGSTRFVYTGLRGGLEHVKIETRLIDERFVYLFVTECFLLSSLFSVYLFFVVYYESMKRELTTRPIYECRCEERLNVYYESRKRKRKNRIVFSFTYHQTDSSTNGPCCLL